VALEMCEEVAAALDVAFSCPTADGSALKLLHRDIKPGNIQITAQGEVKLLDFGVARAEFGGREAHTSSLIFGSLAYLAPERMDFEDTHKGDIYALAVTLYECLTGEALEKASINPRKHRDQIDAAHRRLRAKVGDAEVARLVADCLVYEPGDRPDARTFERRARELRRAFPQPWLRDWAESAVPAAAGARKVDPTFAADHWSGAILDETPASGADATLPLGEAVEPASPAPVPPVVLPTPHPKAAPVRLPPPPSAKKRDVSPVVRPRRGGTNWLGWAAGILLTLVLLAVAGAVLIPVLTGVGLVAAIRGSGIWDDAWAETVQETMVELEPQVQGCAPGREVDRALSILRLAGTREAGLRIGLFELTELETIFQEAVRDGVVTPSELQQIEAVFSRIQES
jgi:serine/threonine-protein kinase